MVPPLPTPQAAPFSHTRASESAESLFLRVNKGHAFDVDEVQYNLNSNVFFLLLSLYRYLDDTFACPLVDAKKVQHGNSCEDDKHLKHVMR